jgi:hypothetical protein
MMDGPGSNERVPLGSGEDLSLEALAAELQEDPEEWWRAFQGLESVDIETRLRIITGLSQLANYRGVIGLLRLLGDSADAATRQAARAVLNEAAGPSHQLVSVTDVAHVRPRLVSCLVTAVDGAGRGSIVLSTTRTGRRATAAFLCDLRRGIIDVSGQLEEETEQAGQLVDEVRDEAGADAAFAPPELAIGLLAASLGLNSPPHPAPVLEWLERTLGSPFECLPFPVPRTGSAAAPLESSDLRGRAIAVLDACPTWFDSSPLTFELAEEILLREGRVASDPERDSGAFRFLFEHGLIHQLELYRRMLLWMAWFWTCSGQAGLAESAGILAWQLADEQFAVPTHPFAAGLMARSLDEAQARLETGTDPRRTRRQA